MRLVRTHLVHRRSGADDRGASLVEFALLLPIFMLLALGMLSGGRAYNRQIDLTHAAREGARYGAIVPADQTFTSGTWDSNVRDTVVSRSAGELDASEVCVALVEGSPGAVIAAPAGHTQDEYSTNGTSPCIAGETYATTSSDNGRRVQVSVQTPDKIEALLFSYDLTLKASASVRSESS